MDLDEFLGHVQHRAQLASTGQALNATRSTLQVLGQRLAGGAPGNLAAELPASCASTFRIRGAVSPLGWTSSFAG